MKHLQISNTARRTLALSIAFSLVSLMMFVVAPLASAQTSLSQCNGTDNVGGQAVECHYTVTNNLNGGVTSSSVTLTECHGAANDPPTMVCDTTVTNATELVTSLDQCNGSGNGGGGTVTCTVDVVNNITGVVTPTSATVNQCNASGTGGGTEPTILCDPYPANTTGATVTQCNESGNGGGGTQRVQCSVGSGSTMTSVLNVTVNQCNGSGNGGGALVTCSTTISNNIQQGPGPSPTPTVTPTVTPAPTPTEGTGGPDGSPEGPDAAPEGPDMDTGQVSRVPTGGAGAGGGSTGGIEYLGLLILGGVLMAASVPALAVRRRSRA
jgi:hypothetical protein